MTSSPPPYRDFMQGSALRFVRSVGSWKGRAPHWIELARIARDGRTAVLESNAERWVADLVEGTVTVDPRGGEALGALVSALRNERRRGTASDPRAQMSVVVTGESPSENGSPRYAQVWVGWHPRLRSEVLEADTGRPLLRLPRRWRAGFSACGAFFVCFAERGRRALVYELATRARREVALDLGAPVEGAPQVGPGGRDAVLQLRARPGGTRTLVGVSLDDGSERWRRSIASDEYLVGRSDETRGEEGPRVWTASGDEALRGYGASDGALARTVRDVGRVQGASFAPDGSFAVVAQANLFARVDLRGGEVLAHAADSAGPVEALAWAPGSERFAAALRGGRVRVYARDGGEPLRELEPSDPRGVVVERLAFEPGSARLWSLGRTVRARRVVLEALDTSSGLSEAAFDLGPGAPEYLVAAPDGSCLWLLLHGTERRAAEGVAVLWSCRERRILLSRAFKRAREAPAVGFARDERGGGVVAELYLFEALTRERFSVVTGDPIDSSPMQLEFLEAFDPRIALFSPDGDRMYALSSGELAVYERGDRGALPPTLVRAEFEFDEFTRKALAPGDSVFAYLDDLGALWLRGVDGRFYEQLVFESQQDRFVEVALSPDGRTLLAGTEAGVIVVFAISVE